MIGAQGIVMTKQPQRLGVPLTRKEAARYEAEQAAIRAAEKKAVADRAKSLGMKKRQVRAPDGSVQEVWSFAASYGAMGFQDHQVKAAERFESDWSAAYRTIRGQGYEPGVDGGRDMHAAHVSQVSAQMRLAAIQKALSAREWAIVTAVAIYGASARQIHAMGGKDHRTVADDIKRSFDALDGFYNGHRKTDTTWRAVLDLIDQRSAMIEQAEREMG